MATPATTRELVGEITAALERFDVPDQRRWAAVAHLASGPEVLYGVHLRASEHGGTVVLDHNGATVRSPAHIDRVVAAARTLTGGTCYDFTGRRGDLVDVHRSGVHVVAYGAHALFGVHVFGPEPNVLRAWMSSWDEVPTSGIWVHDSVEFGVENSGDKIVLRNLGDTNEHTPTPPGTTLPETDPAAAAADWCSQTLQLRTADVVHHDPVAHTLGVTPTIEVLFTIDATDGTPLDVIVPIVIGAHGSFAVGSTIQLTRAATPPQHLGGSRDDHTGIELPAPWTALEPAVFEPGVIASHTSGIRALIRRR